jgi:hypothetical protein
MIIDVHVHHVPEAFARFVERAAPYAMRLDQPRGESVMLHVGKLSYGLSRTFFDSQRLYRPHGGDERRTDGTVAGDAVRQLRRIGEP